eukprot:109198_1
MAAHMHIVQGYCREHEDECNTEIHQFAQFLIVAYYYISESLHQQGRKTFKIGNRYTKVYRCTHMPEWGKICGQPIIDLNDTSISRYNWIFTVQPEQLASDFGIAIGIEASCNGAKDPDKPDHRFVLRLSRILLTDNWWDSKNKNIEKIKYDETVKLSFDVKRKQMSLEVGNEVVNKTISCELNRYQFAVSLSGGWAITYQSFGIEQANQSELVTPQRTWWSKCCIM